jgi:hypothetical protein
MRLFLWLRNRALRIGVITGVYLSTFSLDGSL